MKTTDLTRITNDINGNPRYVCHFFNLLTELEIKDLSLDEAYKIAVKAANTIGGKKYHTKSYGGGIVFQSYNTNELINKINELTKID